MSKGFWREVWGRKAGLSEVPVVWETSEEVLQDCVHVLVEKGRFGGCADA